MLDVRHLTSAVLVLTTLEITATSTNALLPTHLQVISGRALAQPLQAQDSPAPNSVKQPFRQDAVHLASGGDSPPPTRKLSVSGIEGRSTSSRMPGIIQRNPDGSERKVAPVISGMPIPITVLNQAGRKVADIKPDKEGYFRVTLKPGRYRLVPKFQDSNYLVLNSRDKLKTIKVTQGKFTTVNVTYTELIP
ncbi:carboxypeptidase-like regulatory domain-containing protein [Allocoleopsis sp.]|uniref:carboxypeptidase-like regulatory domain-containing protein n=1 Tax=Allocoleopsis sp. TaxID=3088169 RepID=UPI002FD3733E